MFKHVSWYGLPATSSIRHSLLVEDNDYNVDVAKEMLEYMGHGVTVSARSE